MSKPPYTQQQRLKSLTKSTLRRSQRASSTTLSQEKTKVAEYEGSSSIQALQTVKEPSVEGRDRTTTSKERYQISYPLDKKAFRIINLTYNPTKYKAQKRALEGQRKELRISQYTITSIDYVYRSVKRRTRTVLLLQRLQQAILKIPIRGVSKGVSSR